VTPFSPVPGWAVGELEHIRQKKHGAHHLL
jgi:hypothetical protein